MSSDGEVSPLRPNYTAEIGRECIRIQLELARRVKPKIDAANLYVFDGSAHFANARTELVDGFRVLVSDDGKYALLSQSAQTVLKAEDATHTYLQISGLDPSLHDDTGAFIQG